jgi:hypothetical protein
MDLWVVNDTIRRSRMRDVRALPRSEAPGSGGVLASQASAGQRGLSAQGLNRTGAGIVGDQACWN